MEEYNFISKLLYLGSYQFYLELALAFLVLAVNFKKRKFFYFFIPLMLAIGIPYYFLPHIQVLGFNIGYLLVFATIIVVMIPLYDVKINYIIVNALVAFSLQHISWNLMFILLDVLPLTPESPQFVFILIMLGVYILIYGVTLFFFWKFKIKLSHLSRNPVVITLGVINIAIVFILSQLIGSWTPVTRAYTILSSLLCSTLLYVYPYSRASYERRKELVLEKQMLERLIELQARENETYRETREILNMKYHDLKHQLDVLSEIKNRNEMVENIKDIKNKIYVYDAYASTGNTVVDIVLTQKSLICSSKNIRFTYIVDGEALKVFSNNDIASLLGNILDNAIEAADKEEGDYRLIKLNVAKNNRVLTISQSNYTKNHPVTYDDLPKSTKMDQGIHGYGLKSIKYITEKYGGEMDIKFDEETFRLNLVFPL